MTQKGQQKVLEGQEEDGITLSSSVCAMGGRGNTDKGIVLIPPSCFFFHFAFILTYSLTISRQKETLRGVTLDKNL